MEYQFSAFDIHFMLKELRNVLIDGKVNKIYQSEKREFLFDFHIAGRGKTMLKISLPSVMHMTTLKFDMPMQPPHFCMVLRKYLGNAFLREINQVGFERIVDFVFDAKDGKKHLFVEFFSKGNMFFTDQDLIIKSLLEPQKWKDRTLRGNIKYEYPMKPFDPLEIDYEEFNSLIEASGKESIVKTLAIDFGFGGRYAEELCIRAKVDKEKHFIDDDEKRRLYGELSKMADEDILGIVYYHEGEPKMISPISLFSADIEQENFGSFNEALDKVLSEDRIEDYRQKALAPYEKKKRKLQLQIEQQEKQLKKLQQDAVEFQKKGELIYDNYQLLDPVLKELSDIIKKHPQKDIKEKLKDHPLIKEINFKDKTVLVELKE